MNELLTEMKKYTDESKEQVKDLVFKQIKALQKRFNAVVMKETEENLLFLNSKRKGTRYTIPKNQSKEPT